MSSELETQEMLVPPSAETLQSGLRDAVLASLWSSLQGTRKLTDAEFAAHRLLLKQLGDRDACHADFCGDYELLGKLGEGGMGVVYKARHKKSDRLVALKTLPLERLQKPRAKQRFERETKVLGQLDHPNIVRAIDRGEAGEVPYLVMELVNGCDLSELANAHGPFSTAAACEIARQTALGLQHIHEQGLVHRDIKPSNLMLTAPSSSADSACHDSACRVQLLDLGLARSRDDGGETELTGTGYIVGTLDYMAPEQAKDIHTVDIRADIFSLGATLYKLLSGKSPLEKPKRTTAINKIAALITEPIPSLREACPEAPEALIEVVDKMLARESDDRFSTPAEVAAALAPFAQGANLAALSEAAAEKRESRELASVVLAECSETRKCSGTFSESATSESATSESATSESATSESATLDGDLRLQANEALRE
jgi:serine/threonine protein kinase